MGEGLRWLKPETEKRVREQISEGNELRASKCHLWDTVMEGPKPPDESYSWIDQEDWQYFKNWSAHMHRVYYTSREITDLARDMLRELGCEVPKEEMTYEEEMNVLADLDEFMNPDQ